MAEFVFTSPGVKFKERDLTFVTRNVGVTTLGLVGETLKGPAFEPVFIQDKTQFAERFGAQSIERFSNGDLKYQLPYVANAYLDESNQLWVTRVLGLSGYDAGTAWAITLSAGVDPSTNRKALEISSKYSNVKAALGIYPPDAFSRETGREIELDIDSEIRVLREKMYEKGLSTDKKILKRLKFNIQARHFKKNYIFAHY